MHVEYPKRQPCMKKENRCAWDSLVKDVDEGCACDVAAAAEVLPVGAELILVLWDPHDIAPQHQPEPAVAQLHGTAHRLQPELARTCRAWQLRT